jgi:predicted naringenin-chalcone synthase
MSIDCIIGDFRILKPKHVGGHAEAVQWLASAHAHAEASRIGAEFDEGSFRTRMERLVTRYGCNSESLSWRGFDMDDFIQTDWSEMRVFDVERDPNGAGMTVRMEVFQEVAERAFNAFYPEPDAPPASSPQTFGGSPGEWGPQEPPRELIHVSCTGYVAPSAPQLLVAKRGWRGRTGVVHAYHMGCYASMPALRMATAFMASPRVRSDRVSDRVSDKTSTAGRVDIVHTEFCSLHLNVAEHMPEQLVAQSLFADGHIRYSVRAAEGEADGMEGGFRFLGVHEEILPDTGPAIGWRLGDHGMRIALSRDVPDLIASSLDDFLESLFARTGTDAREAMQRGLFAVHPGGPRIIDKVADLLDLRPDQVAHSRAVLKACGNMSSATLPHVWAGMLSDDQVPSGTLITSLAFGPGLTLYGAMLRKV